MSVQKPIFQGRRTDNGKWVRGVLVGEDVIVPSGKDLVALDHDVVIGPETLEIDPATIEMIRRLKS